MFTGAISASSACFDDQRTSRFPVEVVSCRRAEVRLRQLPEAWGEQSPGEPPPASHCPFLAVHVAALGKDQATDHNLFETGSLEKFHDLWRGARVGLAQG